MTPETVSIVVVSRGRPQALARCLTGISQLQASAFEVVVVADPAGIASARALPFGPALKLIPFDLANVSAARNLGVSHAAGDVVAFIDDDAVPEPSWLRHLTAPALSGSVEATGGYVRGRNGISFQWEAQALDSFGVGVPLALNRVTPTVLTPPNGRAVKTEGTNMAFRRTVLVELGGFDEAFRYFLDETDLNMRLAKAGHATAIVPLAQVHHGFEPNAARGLQRVPRDLFEIGASWAVFHRKHLSAAARPRAWEDLRQRERKRLLRHMVAGRLEPGAVRHLMRRLDQGHAAGLERLCDQGAIEAEPLSGFRVFPAQVRSGRLISGRVWQAKALHVEAAERVSAGDIVTLILLSPTTLFHRIRFCDAGYWLQTGGLFGKSERHEPLFRWYRHAARIRKERDRIRAIRVM